MEALLNHLLTTTTAIREDQIRLVAALDRVLTGQRDLQEGLLLFIRDSRAVSPPSSPRGNRVGMSIKHMIGLMIAAHLLRGGDISTVIELLKLWPGG